jgi:hypothetical protein
VEKNREVGVDENFPSIRLVEEKTVSEQFAEMICTPHPLVVFLEERAMKKKKKMTTAEIKKAKKLAEKMKGKPEIDNPHALSRHVVKKQRKKKRGGKRKKK